MQLKEVEEPRQVPTARIVEALNGSVAERETHRPGLKLAVRTAPRGSWDPRIPGPPLMPWCSSQLLCLLELWHECMLTGRRGMGGLGLPGPCLSRCPSILVCISRVLRNVQSEFTHMSPLSPTRPCKESPQSRNGDGSKSPRDSLRATPSPGLLPLEQAYLKRQHLPSSSGNPLLSSSHVPPVPCLCRQLAGPPFHILWCTPSPDEMLFFFLHGFMRPFLVTSDFKGSHHPEDHDQTPICKPSSFWRQGRGANKCLLSRRDTQPLLSDLTNSLTFSFKT